MTLSQFAVDLENVHCGVMAGHLTGCGDGDPHNSPTSAYSASLGHFSTQNYKIATYKRESNCLLSSGAKIVKRLVILKKLFTENSDQNTTFCS